MQKLTITRRLLFMGLLFLSISCEKETGELGENLIGDEGFVVEVRTDIPLSTYTIFRDSVSTLFPSRFVVGYSNDADFGQTSAGFISQLRPESTNPTFGTNARLDSVWLILEYELPAFSNRINTPLNLEVHRLTENFDPDRLYYNTSTIPVEDDPLAVISNFTPNFKKNVFIGDTSVPALVVPLDVGYFEELIFSDTAAPNLQTLNSFVEYIKGIRMQALSGEGFVYFKAESPLSGIRLFYSNDDTVNTGLKFFTLQMHPDNRSFNQAFHDLTGSSSGESQDTIQGMERTYCSSIGGPTTVVHFPDLSFLGDSVSVINKCVLRIPIAPGSQAVHRTPSEMLAFEPNTLVRIPDFVGDQFWPGNGSMQSGVVRNGMYEINVTFFLMNAYVKKKPLTFELLPVEFRRSARRVVLTGSADTQMPIEVVLYYSTSKQ
jgi:hypothetical protein